MDWVAMAGFIFTGGIGTAIVNELLRGWRQRNRAKGSQDSLLDALRRSRLWWMEHAYRARRVSINAGVELPPFVETDDPYLQWEADTPKAEGKD